MRIGVTLLALLALPALTGAQTADSRWHGYLGCWELQHENTAESLPDLESAASRALPSPNQRRDDVRVCLSPADRPLVVAQQMQLNGEPMTTDQVAADGSTTYATEGTCRTSRTAEWSTSGRLLLTRGRVECDGQPAREVSGLSYLTRGPVWVEIQVADIDGAPLVRVRRYEQRRSARVGGMPGPAFDQWTLPEVMEASRVVAAGAIQASLVDTGTRLDLSTARLRDLARAQVPDDTIDLLLALRYPEAFVVERSNRSSVRSVPNGWSYGWGDAWGWNDPWAWGPGLWQSPVYGGVPPAWAWSGMYMPFGYGFYGWGYPTSRFRLRGNQTGGFAVNPGDDRRDSGGRVINGRGYTRVQPRYGEPARPVAGGRDADGDASSSDRPRRRSGGGVTTSGYSGGGASSGSGSSSGGSSGGSSAGDGGGSDSGSRTAVPRPPGGGL
jgi:hypothetical protein